MSDVIRILSQIEQGDPQAAEKLLPLVYDELRKLAAAKMAQKNPRQTLQATAMVHDACIRLVGSPSSSAQMVGQSHWNGRWHFFGTSVKACVGFLLRARVIATRSNMTSDMSG